ncbi:hypothetical protein OSTOST_23588 [Ostertagia ostertagi]
MSLPARLFLLVLSLPLCFASQISRGSYGSAGEHAGYGHDEAHHHGGYYDTAHHAHGHESDGFSEGDKIMLAAVIRVITVQVLTMKTMQANTLDLLVIMEETQKRSHMASSTTSTCSHSIHVEKFHSDEKHAKKYGSDSHASGAQEHSDGDHYSKGHDAYHDSHGAHGAHHGTFSHGEGGHGFSKKGHQSGYGGEKGGHYDYGHNGHGDEYSQYYHAPHHDKDSYEHDAYNGHGRHEDYGNEHHDRPPLLWI